MHLSTASIETKIRLTISVHHELAAALVSAPDTRGSVEKAKGFASARAWPSSTLGQPFSWAYPSITASAMIYTAIISYINYNKY